MNEWQDTEITSNRPGYTLRVRTVGRDESLVGTACAYWADNLTGLTRVNSSPEAIVAMGSISGRSGGFYFKRYLMRDKYDFLKHVFRRSRAGRELYGCELVSSFGIKTPKPVCLIEERRLGIVTGSALITEAVVEVQSLTEYMSKRSLAAPERGMFLKGLGEEVAKWHNAGLCHGDMRSGNILCRRRESGFQFYWLDNERSRKTNSRHERVRNLVQLNMTRDGVKLTDRMHFWRAYAGAVKCYGDDKDKKDILRQVATWTRKRWRQRKWCE